MIVSAKEKHGNIPDQVTFIQGDANIIRHEDFAHESLDIVSSTF